MQRSRRAFLQRRALEKVIGARNRFYKLSLSLVFITWAILILCILWIGRSGGLPEDSFENYPRMSSVAKQSTQPLGNLILGDTCVASSDATKEENTSNEKSASPLDMHVGNSQTLSHSAPIALEEFKRRVFISKSKSSSEDAENVVHRLEPGGQKYNYASSSKGAKVLSFNKEAKGASNILCSDKDKYLRNPCSSEEKFVVIELSEETLVDTIEIANFEHHSSNVKDFELMGSLSYPTEHWTKLGNFTAGNTKNSQLFTLEEAKWVRYLKINLLTHHGSEFYCTLSLFEVYGMDAVERMLQDLISNQLSAQPNERNSFYEGMDPKVGRSQGDTALKVLMQKVRSLDESLSVLEQYMEVVNAKYGYLFKEVDDDLGKKFELVKKAQLDLEELYKSHEITAKEVGGLLMWKTELTHQIDRLAKQNSDLRLEIGKVEVEQLSMRGKNVVIFAVCVIFGGFAIVKMVFDVMAIVFLRGSYAKTTKISDRNFAFASSWSFLLLSCTIIFLIVIT